MYQLDIFTDKCQRCETQYADTLKEAKRKKKELRRSGYVVTVFKKGQHGLIEVA